jgi:hypothetical protein
MLYTKTTDLSMTAVDPVASLTLMSADIERIATGWQYMHEIWANMIEIGVAIYLLERQLGVACAVPVAVAIGKFAILFGKSVGLLTSTASVYDRFYFCYQLGYDSPSNVA